MAVTTDLLLDAGSSSSDGEEFMAEGEESELEDTEEEEEEEAELAEPDEEENTDQAECSSAGRPRPWPPAGAAVGCSSGDMGRDGDCADGAAAAVLLHGRGELQHQHPWRSCSYTASHYYDDERRFKETTKKKKKKSGSGLSPEAALLLQRASRSVRKNMKRARDHHHKMAAPLYSHLHSLQSLLMQSDAQMSGSCVITDALSYMRYLKRQIKDLQGALRTPQAAACTSDIKVELTSMDGPSLLVKVSCEKRPGLLTELMLILERLGLVFDGVNASCHDRMSFEACTAQEGVDLLDKEILKVAITRAISSLQKR